MSTINNGTIKTPTKLKTPDDPKSHDAKPGKRLSQYEYQYDGVIITDVWADNLEQEMHRIIHLVENYPYVAMVQTIFY
jgi:hypothetical protein